MLLREFEISIEKLRNLGVVLMPRVAFVHDWLVTYRGGEKVLEALVQLYPEAPIFTMFYDPKSLPDSLNSRNIIVNPFINRFRKIRKALLPFYPAIVENFELFDYDIVISTSSCVAKGVLVHPNAKHLCYMFSPMRYIWDQRRHYDAEFSSIPGARFFMKLLAPKLRIWDVGSNNGVDEFVAISNFVKSRIKKFYRRDSSIIFPPVEIDALPHEGEKIQNFKEYFVAAGAFVNYKRFDLAIKACINTGKKLVIVGSGPMEASLRRLAGEHCRFVITPTRDHWNELLFGAKAIIFPGTEDFGITPIEALAMKTPIIAHKSGGALDYVVPNKTGEFFMHQNVESLSESLNSFNPHVYDRDYLREYAQQFSTDNFIKQFRARMQEFLGGRDID
jgi:glycosyltransferase involved in cell wall biosynthesis